MVGIHCAKIGTDHAKLSMCTSGNHWEVGKTGIMELLNLQLFLLLIVNWTCLNKAQIISKNILEVIMHLSIVSPI